MLGRGDKDYNDKNWVLIKDEQQLMRNGFKMNEVSHQAWAPQCMYVNVVFNGRFRGFYLLAESVERNVTGRLNVAEDGLVERGRTVFPLGVASDTQLYTQVSRLRGSDLEPESDNKTASAAVRAVNTDRQIPRLYRCGLVCRVAGSPRYARYGRLGRFQYAAYPL